MAPHILGINLSYVT